MSKAPDLVLWWVRWDKAGNVIERLYRPREPEESAPQPEPEPKAAPVRRGGIPGRQAQLGLFGNPN